MTLFFISFLAGVLTVLAPCILPLLPVVIGSSVGARSKFTPYIVIASLALSILLFTFLLKVSTLFIDIPTFVWGYISGGILIVIGLFLLFPQIWEKLSYVNKTNQKANLLVGTGLKKKSVWGDVIIGAALGPVFSSCSPTYFVILATVLPASFLLGTAYLLTYIIGLVLVLVLIAYLGQKFTKRLQIVANNRSVVKRSIGALFLLIGIFIFTGLDKKIEAWILDNGYNSGILQFEQDLLEQVETNNLSEANKKTNMNNTTEIEVPRALARFFPNTDFSMADPRLENAISGGPAKDGIPALDNPKFIPLSNYNRPDAVQSIVLVSDDAVKVYPYNILTWHEIVNDDFGGTPVAITFCPLCGSAIVYNRTLPNDEVSTFGVSGSLLESNMIMYDRATENLWQQSTGKTLAGSFHPTKLEHEPFQLMTLGDIRETYPEALVLSEETGHRRDYGRNPYAGYETSDQFLVTPSNIDETFNPKEIMVVFQTADTTFTAPWQKLREVKMVKETIDDTIYTLNVSENGELTITDNSNTKYPFYFEMWFSVATQHDQSQTPDANDLIIINP